jgi:hypothetical protein
MHDGTDTVFPDDPAYQFRVARIPLDEQDVFGQRITPSGRQIVHNHHRVCGFAKGENGVAADIPGPSGDNDGGPVGHWPIINRMAQ